MGSRAHRRHPHTVFDQRGARADFGFCAKAPYWQPGEAAAVSLGFDWEFVNPDTVKPHRQSSSKAKEFGRRWMLISRAVDMGELKRQFSPPEFVAWADSKNLKLPKKLRNAVATIGAAKAPNCEVDELRKQLEQYKTANRDPHPREFRSLQIIVVGMASGRYGFNPNADRNLATKAIVDDVERLGLLIDKDTVLTHVRRAYHDLDLGLPDT
jgi:hypothetical protein